MRIAIDIEKRLGGAAPFTLRVNFAAATKRLVLFGPSGSGKTLTLKALAGLLRPDAGRIELCGRRLFDTAARLDLSPKARRMGYVFQDYALFPHLTVRDNVAFGLKPLFGRLSPAKASRVDEVMAIFGIDALAGLRPGSLSGGQRQRVALARAVAGEPGALLLDEPFTALDIPLRNRLRGEISAILDRLDIPLVLVTHDPADALAFGGQAAVYRHGEVVNLVDLDQDRPESLLEAAFDAAAAPAAVVNEVCYSGVAGGARRLADAITQVGV